MKADAAIWQVTADMITQDGAVAELARIIHRGLLSGVTPGAGACFFVASGTR
jgi:hypothetical protein